MALVNAPRANQFHTIFTQNLDFSDIWALSDISASFMPLTTLETQDFIDSPGGLRQPGRSMPPPERPVFYPQLRPIGHGVSRYGSYSSKRLIERLTDQLPPTV